MKNLVCVGVYSNYLQLTVQFMIVVYGYIEVRLLDHLVSSLER